MAIGSSGNRNGGVGRNNCGVAAKTEAVAVVAMVETMAATAAKLRCLRRKRYW